MIHRFTVIIDVPDDKEAKPGENWTLEECVVDALVDMYGEAFDMDPNDDGISVKEEKMLLTEYLKTRRKELEGLLETDALKLQARASLTELDDINAVIKAERYYKVSTDGNMITFEAHGMSSAEVLIALTRCDRYVQKATLEAKK